jgi:hypothetical protein
MVTAAVTYKTGRISPCRKPNTEEPIIIVCTPIRFGSVEPVRNGISPDRIEVMCGCNDIVSLNACDSSRHLPDAMFVKRLHCLLTPCDPPP